MKKIFFISMFCIFSMSGYAQKNVTKFLGIPIDGTKSEMIQKLRAKGYMLKPGYSDILEGEFNGTEVNIHIATNNNKVCRIMVADVNTQSEGDIKIRFNRLCKQFQENTKYIPIGDYRLSDEEDISYEMSVHSKRYEATFIQLPISMSDTIAIAEEMQSILLSKYTQEELSNMTEDKQQQFTAAFILGLMEKYSNNIVWFMINRHYGEYYISMFYDNKNNQANGEDL